jgi:hypothetical protein
MRYIALGILLAGAGARAGEPDVAARWSFECDPAAGVAIDDSGNGNHAALSEVTAADGPWGGALRFPPVADAGTPVAAVPTPPGSTLNVFDAGITLEAFINPAELPIPPDSVDQRFRTILWADDEIYSLALRSDAAGVTTLSGGINCGRRNSGAHDVSAAAAFDNARAGSWSHIALTFGDNVLRLFVDGQKVAETTDTGDPLCESRIGPVSPLREFFAIGIDEAGGRRAFRGLVDEVVVWRRPLGEAEVATRSQRTGPGASSGCDVPTPVCIGDDHVQCFDDDPCTRDTCRSFACENTAPVSLPTASCRVGRFQDENVCDDPLVAAAERLLTRRSEAALRLIESITGAMKAAKVVKVLTRAQKQLTRIERRISRGKLASQVDEACRTRLLALVATGRSALESLADLYRS